MAAAVAWTPAVAVVVWASAPLPRILGEAEMKTITSGERMFEKKRNMCHVVFLPASQQAGGRAGCCCDERRCDTQMAMLPQHTHADKNSKKTIRMTSFACDLANLDTKKKTPKNKRQVDLDTRKFIPHGEPMSSNITVQVYELVCAFLAPPEHPPVPYSGGRRTRRRRLLGVSRNDELLQGRARLRHAQQVPRARQHGHPARHAPGCIALIAVIDASARYLPSPARALGATASRPLDPGRRFSTAVCCRRGLSPGTAAAAAAASPSEPAPDRSLPAAAGRVPLYRAWHRLGVGRPDVERGKPRGQERGQPSERKHTPQGCGLTPSAAGVRPPSIAIILPCA